MLKIYFSEQGPLLASCRIEREKFYPGPGLESGPLAYVLVHVTLRSPGQVPIHDRISPL